MQTLITGLDHAAETGNVDDFDIVLVKSKRNQDAVQTIEGPVLSLTRGVYRNMLGSVVIQHAPLVEGGSLTVPAGTFTGTTKTTTSVRFMGSSYTSEIWLHPNVPINACVKSVSSENKSVMELIDFGMGAVKGM